MPLNLISAGMLGFGVIVTYSGFIFLNRPEDALNKSIHYDSSTMEPSKSLLVLTYIAGALLGLLGLGIILFATLFVIK